MIKREGSVSIRGGGRGKKLLPIREGEGILRRSKRRRHLQKIRRFQNLDKFFFGQTDRPTDRQTDIVVHRKVTIPKTNEKTVYMNRAVFCSLAYVRLATLFTTQTITVCFKNLNMLFD